MFLSPRSPPIIRPATSAALSEPNSTVSIRTTPDRGLDLACLCAKVADEFRGGETLVLDLTGITPIVDYFVITTGTSQRQMHALAEEISRVVRQRGTRPMGTEGGMNSHWILQDYGDVVLHLFSAQARQNYDLENLWADAPRIDWQSYPDVRRQDQDASLPTSSD